jgi:3-oxoadipate enol-lactonase
MSHFTHTTTAGDGARIAYRFDGDAGKPVLLLSNSIGTTLSMWDGEFEALGRHFHVLRYDTRGHGGSGVTPGAYSMDRLGRDAIELLDALKIERAHFLGLSLGGFIGRGWACMRPSASTGWCWPTPPRGSVRPACSTSASSACSPPRT